MKMVEKIVDVLQQMDMTALQIQQATGINNIKPLLWHLSKNNRVFKYKKIKENYIKGPRSVYIYSLNKPLTLETETVTEAANQDAQAA
jgi:hypothetical protein